MNGLEFILPGAYYDAMKTHQQQVVEANNTRDLFLAVKQTYMQKYAAESAADPTKQPCVGYVMNTKTRLSDEAFYALLRFDQGREMDVQMGALCPLCKQRFTPNHEMYCVKNAGYTLCRHNMAVQGVISLLRTERKPMESKRARDSEDPQFPDVQLTIN